MMVLMETIAESGKGSPVKVSTRFSLGVENERADAGRDGTAEPNSQDQILRSERGQGENPVFPVQLTTSMIGNHTRLMPILLKVMTTHTNTPTHIDIS